MQLLHVDASLEKHWNDYVKFRTGAVTDLFGWRRVVWDAYRIPSHFIAVEDNGAFVGSLGLFQIKHRIFGHYLTTAIFSTDGGLYYDNARVLNFLITEAKRLANKLGVDYLSIRTRGIELEGFTIDRHYRTSVLDMNEGVDAVWEKALRAKTRNQVRRGIQEGFTIQTGHDQREAFYRVFHTHMRDLGSPAHSRHFYRAIERHLGDKARFIVVRDGRNPVAGALLLELNGTAMNIQTVALKQYNRRCPNYLLYWDMIRNSCVRGNRRFDMGRSEEGSPNLGFKKHWGAQSIELNYNYYLANLDERPYLDPRNPKYRLAIAVWKQLPLAITRFLGPRLIRGLA
ncbi:MAG: FemAB family PEP-CTERM system-associated protein [Gammaproteobacteria bacterium]|nr:FemAB family PEP-CTERM system-associated protein [Gammaproteobacteria bacterium]NNJ83791.1 FemAB family PEP-CTERM system-associated protein [Gammaproteobacteria bacterium]